MPDIFAEQELTEIDVQALVELLNDGAERLKHDVGHIIDHNICEIPDEINLERMLTQVGHAILRSSGEDRPLTVKVAFE